MTAAPSLRPRLARAAAWLGAGLFFLAASLVSLVLHVNHPAVRHAVERSANAVLRNMFLGRLVLEDVQELSLDAVRVRSVQAFDPDGLVVLRLENVRLEAGGVRTLSRLLRRGPGRSLRFDGLQAERVEARLVPAQGSSELTLVRAFTPRVVEAEPKDPNTRVDSQLWLPNVEVGEVNLLWDANDGSPLNARFTSVHGSVHRGKAGWSVSLDRFGVTTRGFPRAEPQGTGSFALRPDGSVMASFAGAWGNLELQASARYAGDLLSASVNAPRATVTGMRQLLPEWPVVEPAEIRLTANGPLKRLSLDASVETSNSALDATGVLRLGDDVTLSLELESASLGARSFSTDAVDAQVNLTGRLNLQANADSWNLQANAKTGRTRVGDVELPPATLLLQAAPSGTSAHLEVLEPGAKLQADLTFNASKGAVDAKWSLAGVNLGTQARLPDGLGGTASSNGQLHYEGGKLRIDGTADVTQFSAAGLRVGRGRLTLRSTGTPELLAESRLTASLEASNIAAYGLHFDRANARLAGTRHGGEGRLELSAEDGRKIRLSGSLLPNLTVRAAHAELERGALRARAEITTLDPNIPTFDAPAVEITGPGLELRGRVRASPGILEAEAHGHGLSLAKVAQLVGLTTLPVAGTADVDGEVTIGPGLQRGTLSFALRDAAISHVGRAALEVQVDLRADELEARATGSDELFGNFSGDAQLQLADSALSLDAYKYARGKVNFDVRDVPLDNLKLLGDSTWLSSLEGRAGVHLELERNASEIPDVTVELRVPTVTAVIPQLAPERLPQHAVLARVSYSHAERLALASGVLNDAQGTLLTVSAALPVDLRALLHAPSAELIRIRNAPLRANVSLPPRAVRDLPLIVTRQFGGQLDVQLDVLGSLYEPDFNVLANLRNFTTSEVTTPLAGQLSGAYSTATGRAASGLSAAAGSRTALTARFDGVIPWGSVLYGGPWRGRGFAEINQLPLQTASALAAAQVNGLTTGRIAFDKEDSVALDADVNLSDVYVGRTPVGNGKLSLHSSPEGLKGAFDLVHEASSLRLEMNALAAKPTTDSAQPTAASDGGTTPLTVGEFDSIDCNVVARQVGAAVLAPLVGSVVARLNGKLDGNVRLGLDRVRAGTQSEWVSTVEGNATLKQGSGYVDVLGLELQDVEVTAQARSRGKQTELTLRDVVAKARSETPNVEARSTLLFDGPRLSSGEAQALLRGVPLTLQGLNWGKASAKVDARFERRQGWPSPVPKLGADYLEATVALENWNLRASPSASRSLISLDPNPEISVRQRRTKRVTDEPLPYRLHLLLGEDGHVTMAEQELGLSGNIDVEYAEPTQISGILDLKPGGRINLLGQAFEVVSGTIRLNPNEPGNPELQLSLSVRTKDGTSVPVSVAGTWAEPITDPAPAELQRLIGGGTGNLLSGTVQQLGLGGLMGDQIQLGATDGSTDKSRGYSASFKISDDLWFEANYQKDSGDSLTQKEATNISGTLDYRFQRNWSLRTRVGTTSGSLDIAWQHRY